MKGSLYVNLLGVDPSIQGKGYGYALMKKMLELAKEQKVDLTLISDLEKNVSVQGTVKEQVADSSTDSLVREIGPGSDNTR
jgi:GNAT superfamily N-acetyltransferase